MSILLFIAFYLLVIPLTVLLHEVGHGLGVLITTKAHAKVYLGDTSNTLKETFRIGKMHFHIRWAYYGSIFYFNASDELNKFQ